MLSGYNVPSDSKETELGSSNQEASPIVEKNTGVFFAPCLQTEVRHYSYFRWCEGHKNYFKDYFKDYCLMNSHLSIFNIFKFNQLGSYY